MKRTLNFLIAVLFAAIVALPALAQAPTAVQGIAPLTRDIGNIRSLTLAGPNPGTYTSVDQSGYNVTRVVCVFNATSWIGASASVLSIRNKDAASGLYYTLAGSASIVSNTTMPVPVAAVGVSSPIAARWQVSVAQTGGTVVAGTVGCSVQ